MTNYNLVKQVLIEHSSHDKPLESCEIHRIICYRKPGLDIGTVRRILKNMVNARNSGVYRTQRIGKRGFYYLYWYTNLDEEWYFEGKV